MALTAAGDRRHGPWRWLVALAATAILVVASSGLVAFAQTGGAAAGPSFLPVGTPIYLEIRADLPSGQDQALAQMMTAFPGFADAATFDMKVDEALDAALMGATEGLLSWTRDIRSWFSGEISVGITGLPDTVTSSGSADLPVLMGLSVTDADAFDATIAKLLEAGGSDVTENVTQEDHQGTTITLAPDLAFAVLDDLILLSNEVDQVKVGLDVLAGAVPSLASDAAFQAAFARVPAAHLHAGYVDFDAFRSLIEQGLEASGVSGGDSTMLELLPVDATWYAAVRPGGAIFEAFVTAAPGWPALMVGESDLAASFPAATQVYLEARELGGYVRLVIERIKAQMGDEVEGLEAAEQLLGGPLEELLAWAGDISVGAGLAEGELWLGVAAEVTDTATAAELVTGLLATVSLFGAQPDSGITVETSYIADLTVTTITLAAEGMTDQLPLPIVPSLSIALDGDRLLIGTGTFVATALELTRDASLAVDPRFDEAVSSLGTPNGGFLYTDISGLTDTLAPLLAFAVPGYADIAPLVEPFDRLVAGTNASEGLHSLTVQLYLR